jgi:hypothetical protein
MQQLQSVHMSDKTQALVMHQTAGILNPTDPKDSTAALHGSMITAGIASGFAHPLGLGLGATCLAAEKLGGNASGTEFDISNMFSSLGFIGGFLYVFIIGTVLAAAFRNWHEARSYPAMCIVGVLIAMFGLWLAGEVYSAVFLIWFSIGSLDRIMRDRHRAVSDAGMHALPRQRRTAA